METPRLLLRSMTEDDFEGLYAIFSDPLVMASFASPPFTREQMQRWVKRNLAHQAEHGYGLFSVIRREDGLLVGNCGLEVMQIDGAAVHEIGYDFRSDCWNRGYATEAAIAVREYAFGELGTERLIALIRVGNLASRRVAEKIGMSLELEYDRGGANYWRYGMRASRPS